MGFKTLPNLSTDKAFTIGKAGEPESVEGYYIGAKEVPNHMSKTGKSALHIFHTETGNVGAWGKMSLDTQLSAVRPGTMTRVTFTGLIKSSKPGRKPAYSYQVEIDEGNTIAVSSATSDVSALADEDYVDSDLDADSSTADAVEYTPPTAPKAAAKAPSPAQQAHVKALLNGNRSKN